MVPRDFLAEDCQQIHSEYELTELLENHLARL